MNTFNIVMLLIVLTYNMRADDVDSLTKQRYKSLELFSKVLFTIENQYYQVINHEKLVEGAISGMVATLDPHSSYLNKSLMKKVKDDTEGNFGGLGIEVYRKENSVFIVNVMDGSPAQSVKILPGDKIVEINKKSTIGSTFEQVIELLQGKVGEEITLGILREEEKEMIRFKMKRRVIKIKPVQATLLSDHIAYIRLIQFQDNAGSEVEKNLKQLKSTNKIKGIILDLRNNPGGLLDEAVNVSSLFLSGGTVVSTEARDPSHKDIRYVKKSVYKDTKTPMIVLINGSSASASEIVAGAMQDHGRALIVGGNSFGKGSVQSVAQVNNEVGLKLTIAQYLTPKLRKIQAIGIKPDIALRDIDLEWLENEKKTRNYLRESDLKNHLSAASEDKNIKKKPEYEKSTLEEKLENDYQVQQSVKILDSINFFNHE